MSGRFYIKGPKVGLPFLFPTRKPMLILDFMDHFPHFHRLDLWDKSLYMSTRWGPVFFLKSTTSKPWFLKLFVIGSGVARAFPGGRPAHPEGQNEEENK